VTPVLTGKIGTISKPFRKHLKNTGGKHDDNRLQEIAKQGTLRTYFGKGSCKVANVYYGKLGYM
jgi:hypothetical protein